MLNSIDFGDDLMSLESEEIKFSEEEMTQFFEVGDGKNTVAVIGEVICSEESLESVPSFIEEYDGELVEDNKITFLKEQKDQVQQPSHYVDFVSKVWTAFLTFHVFIIPAVIGMILSVITKYESGFEDQYQDIKFSVMLGFLASSVVIGLPFHMLALADLEDTVNDIILHSHVETGTSMDENDFDFDETIEMVPMF
ncbi:hypothetical protein CDAR_536131 [Caerostris darwini]|uniref:Uncharacterized protein n=1 Tax=Caerostris darwini TaxID=1538125 RepID=A0AAV4V5Z0_9ARAC|nr:hypothetical protein CDAR_536131 [Caerostris darwini]